MLVNTQLKNLKWFQQLRQKKEGKSLPQGLKPFRGSRLGTKWDNFDRFVLFKS